MRIVERWAWFGAPGRLQDGLRRCSASPVRSGSASAAASAGCAGGGQVVAATCAPVVLSPCSVGPAFCSDLPGEAPFSDGLARMVGAG